MSSPADVRRLPPAARVIQVAGAEVGRLDRGWRLSRVGARDSWPASVPGTVADAVGNVPDVDQASWDFRTTLPTHAPASGEQLWLRFGGIATRSEVRLNGTLIYAGDSMFTAARVDVTELLRGGDDLLVRCLPLAPDLERSARPRARWRTQVAQDGNLRHIRTSLLGRAPGFAPGPAAVGPWRSMTLEVARSLAVDDVQLRPRMDGSTGLLQIGVVARSLDGAIVQAVRAELRGPTGVHHAALALGEDSSARGELSVPHVARWWPHTHGTPHLYDLHLVVTTSQQEHNVSAGSVGFRTLTAPDDLDRDGLALKVNGIQLFARGAVWTSRVHGGGRADLTALALARDAGLNMLRIPGIGVYETAGFHQACDRLGLLVWQDLMLANFDYPLSDAQFRAELEHETRDVLAGLADRPSTAVVCGGSEVEQQAAMTGVVYPRDRFYDETLPTLVAAAGSDAVCIPSSPWGGDLPFRTDRGVAHYFGVGAYRRPFADARLAAVRFASECLALSNVPDSAAVDALGPVEDVLSGPLWAGGVPRDRGAAWDFEDIRDHYLEALYDIPARALRLTDPDWYLDLARVTSGRVMAEVLGEWRRARSTCHGALILWLADLLPGAGWGLLDVTGRPKPVWHAVRRAFSPVAVWTTDEGLNGVDVHVANDTGSPLSATLAVALYRPGGVQVASAESRIDVAAHGQWASGVEALMGRFMDASAAYRFGPPEFDLLAVTLDGRSDGQPAAVATRMTSPWPAARETAAALGLEGELESSPDGAVLLLRARGFVHGVHVSAPEQAPDDDWFDLVPGQPRRVRLRGPDTAALAVEVRAVNLHGALRLRAGATAVERP